jgi:hypothetical protein
VSSLEVDLPPDTATALLEAVVSRALREDPALLDRVYKLVTREPRRE